MKTIFRILIFSLAFAGVASAQTITNGIKDGALVAASTVNDVDRLRILQLQNGTNANFTATRAQVVAGVVSQVNAASNYFQLFSTTNANFSSTASNTLSAGITTEAAARTAALVSTNAQIQSGIFASSNVNATAINTLSATVTANNSAQTAALIATNGQIQNAMAALSVGVGGGIQNGGNGTLSTGTITNLVQPTIYYSVTAPGAGSYISNINCNASFQKLSIAETVAGSQWLFSPQNFVDGQTLTVIIQNTVATASFGTVAAVTNAANAIFQVHGISGTAFTPVGTSGSVLSTVTSRNGTAYLNWQFVGGVVIFSGTPNL